MLPVPKIEYEASPVTPGIAIKSASLEQLVEEIQKCVNETSGQIHEDSIDFVTTFLRMHKWFTSSERLFTLLTEAQFHQIKISQHSNHCVCSNSETRHRNNASITSLLGKDTHTIQHALAAQSTILGNQLNSVNDLICKSMNNQQSNCDRNSNNLSRATCFIIRYWIQQFPLHFDTDIKLFQLLQTYREHLQSNHIELYNILESCNIPSYDWMRKVTVKNFNHSVLDDSKIKVSLAFQNLSPDELAKHITFIDFKVCKRLSFTDYEEYAKSGTMNGNPRLERSALLFNGLTQWVQLMILSKTTAKQRATIVTKFVKVAHQLLKLKNFNSLMAVIGGVTHSSMSRLAKTFSYVSADTHKTLDELSNLISASNNYHLYRKALSTSADSKHSLPIIGIHLKDLVALHSALPDNVGNPPLINFRKMAQLSSVISTLTKLQDMSLPFSVNTDLIDTLKLALDVFYSEEEIFELSLAREPRMTSSSPAPSVQSNNHQTLFSEWLAGLKPPDKDTISKHVSNMVAAMFKNYDLDKDGHISIEEFENIASTFPFMESFCVLDVDENGLLSEGEIRRYFLLAKCNVLKNTFTHNFTEHTYFKLTYCDHCSGLLWGLIKQGWKCKDCGINAHKTCKDIVIMECRPRAKAFQGQTPSMISPPTPSTPDLSPSESRFTFSQRSVRKVLKDGQPIPIKCQHRQNVSTQTEPISCLPSSILPSINPNDDEPSANTNNNNFISGLNGEHSKKSQ